MKIDMIEDSTLEDINIEIRYPQMNSIVKNLEERINSFNQFIVGEDDGRKYKINVYDIFYIESVDRRTFIYTKGEVYCSKNKLYMFLQELPKNDFVQISKSCILNINVLKCVKALINSKMEATLINDEKIIISRNYISNIKKILDGEV